MICTPYPICFGQ